MMGRELVIWVGFVDKGRDVIVTFIAISRTDTGFGHAFLKHDSFLKRKRLGKNQNLDAIFFIKFERE